MNWKEFTWNVPEWNLGKEKKLADVVLKHGVKYDIHIVPDGSGITKITEQSKGKRRPRQVYP